MNMNALGHRASEDLAESRTFMAGMAGVAVCGVLFICGVVNRPEDPVVVPKGAKIIQNWQPINDRFLEEVAIKAPNSRVAEAVDCGSTKNVIGMVLGMEEHHGKKIIKVSGSAGRVAVCQGVHHSQRVEDWTGRKLAGN
jgi:hypothetical protein